MNEFRYCVYPVGKKMRIETTDDMREVLFRTMDAKFSIGFPFKDSLAIIFNTEQNGLPFNRVVGGRPICGDFIITSVDKKNGNAISLNDEQVARLNTILGLPEGVMILPEGKCVFFQHDEL